MESVKIPEGYQQVMPYLILDDAATFLAFTKKLFDAEEIRKEMRDENTIMHAEIRIGKSVIMLANSTEQYQVQNASMFIYVDNTDEVYKKALKEGATNLLAPADQPYGRAAGIKDPFGNTWWITA